MKEFSPRTDILPAAQLRLWRELSAVPDEFVLYVGTAIALHLGHRLDFDFFSSRSLNLEALEGNIPFLRDAKTIRREKNTLTAIVDRGEPVKVSFFGVAGGHADVAGATEIRSGGAAAVSRQWGTRETPANLGGHCVFEPRS